MNLLQNFLQRAPAKTTASEAMAPTAAPSAALDVAGAEERLARLEASLVDSHARLQQQATSLADALGRACGQWEEAKGQGAATDGLLEERLTATVPSASIADEMKQAYAVRVAAITQRQELVRVATSRLGNLEKALDKMKDQLDRDERTIGSVLESVRKQPAAPLAAEEDGSLGATLMQALEASEEAPAPVTQVEVPAVVTQRVESVPGPQRRTAPRVALVAEVGFGSDTNFFNGFSTDIADGGLFIATCSLLPIGNVVDMSFSLPNGSRIEAKGEVRWVRELDDKNPEVFPGMGVRFVDLAPASRKAINDFVNQREPMFFPD